MKCCVKVVKALKSDLLAARVFAMIRQVSIAFRGGYVPHKSKTSNTKSCILSLNEAKNGSFPLLFAVFKSMNSQNRK